MVIAASTSTMPFGSAGHTKPRMELNSGRCAPRNRNVANQPMCQA
jgi:hypothetical protein